MTFASSLVIWLMSDDTVLRVCGLGLGLANFDLDVIQSFSVQTCAPKIKIASHHSLQVDPVLAKEGHGKL